MSHALLFLLYTLLPQSAHAQTDTSRDAPARVIVPAETVIDEVEFQTLNVEGHLVGPGLPLTTARRTADFAPLLKLRRNFSSEMSQSIARIP